MKKTLSLILCAALVAMSFASCSDDGIETTGTENTPETTGTETTAETEGETQAETAAPEGKTEEEKKDEYVYTPDPANKYTGSVGAGTYSTSVTYSSVKVVNNADRKTLLDTKFENLDGWTFATTGGGSWDSSIPTRTTTMFSTLADGAIP